MIATHPVTQLIEKAFQTFQMNFSKQTQIDHLCYTNSFVMIKQRDVNIWAFQDYLGQTVSSHVLSGSSVTSCL